MRSAALVGLVVCAAVMLGLSPTAVAQAPTPAVVTNVVDGDTVDAQLADGRTVRIRLIGIDTPEVGECGTDEATAYMRQLALGRSVTLVADPTQDVVDRFGRSLFYIDRDDGVDLGREQVRAGWADVYVFDQPFERLDVYRSVAEEAEALERGVWVQCDGQFHRSPDDERRAEIRAREASAVAFMRRYYRRLSNRQFASAWGMLSRPVRREFGRFALWKAGFRRSVGTLVLSSDGRLSSGRAVVVLRLRARDRDVCSGRIVRQFFRAQWVLAPRAGSWVAVRARARKTGGGDVRFDRSECAAKPSPRPTPAPAPAPSPPVNCQGYSPCIPPGPDVDCAGGSGNGPRYRPGPIQVNGSDPYDLDSDGDGVACES